MSKVSERTSFRSPERVVKLLLQVQHLSGQCGHRGDVETILKMCLYNQLFALFHYVFKFLTL